jgi:hypothetical protein
MGSRLVHASISGAKYVQNVCRDFVRILTLLHTARGGPESELLCEA